MRSTNGVLIGSLSSSSQEPQSTEGGSVMRIVGRRLTPAFSREAGQKERSLADRVGPLRRLQRIVRPHERMIITEQDCAAVDT